MKSFTFSLLFISLFVNVGYTQPGFSSVTPLAPVNISVPTKDKPQAKVWNYAGKWWCVLSATTGTKIFRLDGTTWIDILSLNSRSSKPDYCMQGDLVHILFYKGAGNNSIVYTVKYDSVSNSYNLWDLRPAGSNIVFPEGSTTATLIVDRTGRMWVASNGLHKIKVWWSDAPYATWSSSITIASEINDSDICALAALPNQSKIGVFWSDRNTKRFGFKTHPDDSDPAVWSADEVPASQSAIPNTGLGMADDHMNIKVAGDGTLYCAAKSDYNRNGFPKVILLIRRPSGQWDNAYPVTMEPEGTQPIVVLNEKRGTLKVVYTSTENGGEIVYRESLLSGISFSPAIRLISDPGNLYNYPCSTHENYNSEIVILATNVSSAPNQAVGVIASDEPAIIWPPRPTFKLAFHANPNPFSSGTMLSFTLPFSDDYTLEMYNEAGMKQFILSKGHAEAGVKNTAIIKRGSLAAGLYLVTLQTTKSRQTIKVIVSD